MHDPAAGLTLGLLDAETLERILHDRTLPISVCPERARDLFRQTALLHPLDSVYAVALGGAVLAAVECFAPEGRRCPTTLRLQLARVCEHPDADDAAIVSFVADHVFRTTTVVRVEILVDPSDIQTAAALDHHGFHREGVLASSRVLRGAARDTAIYSRVRRRSPSRHGDAH